MTPPFNQVDKTCLLIFGWTILILNACTIVFIEPAKDLEIEVIDVGQGDAILLSYDPWHAMIDVGPPNQGLWDSLDSRGIHTLDWILITHHHLDHFGALLELFPPDSLPFVFTNEDTLKIWNSNTEEPNEKLRTNRKKIRIKNIYHSGDHYLPWEWQNLASTLQKDSHQGPHSPKVSTAFVGDQLNFPKAIRGRIFWPHEGHNKSANSASSVIELIYKKRRMLFTGDLEENEERSLIDAKVLSSVDFLKVGHHGSQSSSSLQFLSDLSPHHKAISLGCNNPYGHPHKSTLAHLRHFSNQPDLEIHDTCQDGTLKYRVNENGVFYME